MEKNIIWIFDKLTKTWIYKEDLSEFLVSTLSYNETYNARTSFYLDNKSEYLEDDKRFLFYDKDFNLVDIKITNKELRQLEKISFRRYHKKSVKNLKRGDILYGKYFGKNKYYTYRYRIDPIPNLLKRKVKWRNSKIKHIVVDAITNKQWARPKTYKDIFADIYDWDYYEPKREEKSWKQKKIRHQWQKNLK